MSSSTAEGSPTFAYLTAGAAGMFCGSCMRDNTVTAALHKLGVCVQLIPAYTPIKTDEKNVSIDHVVFGGINVYLQEKFAPFRWLPTWLDNAFDQPWLINRFAGKTIEIEPARLGALTVSMLQGVHGHQRKEVAKLVRWLQSHVRPNLVNLSNMLIAGCIPEIKKKLSVPVLVTLQGDDIFLDGLPEPYKSQAFDEIQKLANMVDGFIVFSHYYADFMSTYFDIPASKFHIVPLGVETHDFAKKRIVAERPPTIGYLARLAPEKGLHRLVDAFIRLRKYHGMDETRLRIAGWLSESNKSYASEQFHRLESAGLSAAFEYMGTVDRAGKIDFLQSIDVLSVPTVYHDPKGLFVLEALAAGVPCVQPDHGAFPELLAACGGGRLVRPGDAVHLTDTLFEMLSDIAGCQRLGGDARATVLEKFNARVAAQATLNVYNECLDAHIKRPS